MGFELRVKSLGFRGWELGFGIEGVGFWVQDVGLGGLGLLECVEVATFQKRPNRSEYSRSILGRSVYSTNL